MATINELTKTYITAGEALFKAEDDLEKEFEKAKEKSILFLCVLCALCGFISGIICKSTLKNG